MGFFLRCLEAFSVRQLFSEPGQNISLSNAQFVSDAAFI
jgi:hypothetical protein